MKNLLDVKRFERITIVSSKTSEGKTTIAEQMLISAIDSGIKSLFVHNESTPSWILHNLYEKIIGNDSKYYDLVKYNLKYIKEPKDNTLVALNKWHKNKLYLYNTCVESEIEKSIESMIYEKNIKLVIIDSILSAANCHNLDSVSKFIIKCQQMSIDKGVYFIITIHDNQLSYEDLTLFYLMNKRKIPYTHISLIKMQDSKYDCIINILNSILIKNDNYFAIFNKETRAFDLEDDKFKIDIEKYM